MYFVLDLFERCVAIEPRWIIRITQIFRLDSFLIEGRGDTLIYCNLKVVKKACSNQIFNWNIKVFYIYYKKNLIWRIVNPIHNLLARKKCILDSTGKKFEHTNTHPLRIYAATWLFFFPQNFQFLQLYLPRKFSNPPTPCPHQTIKKKTWAVSNICV